MPIKKKEVIVTPLAEKQLLAAKHNSLYKRATAWPQRKILYPGDAGYSQSGHREKPWGMVALF
ncbi:MAG: hypothetical protein NPIRA02_38220 [Nitrospirales bacterium]|nr:MAG: hypothetical protein NPIRA02_38220 [Nitrospirales bacterium]